MPPRIVCNTGPLVALSLLGLENMLAELFQPIIPRAVLTEWLDGDKGRTLPHGVNVIEDPPMDPLLMLQLDAGEAAVIQTAINQSIPTVLIDERKGRKIARRVYGLRTIGTARVLVEAKKARLVLKVAPLFETLKEEFYWIADPIVRWALEEAGEK